MSLQVYVAGSRHERAEINALQAFITAHGHEITFDWTGHEGAVLADHSGGHHGPDEERWAAIADREIRAVVDADVVVVCLSPVGRGRGTFIEVGVALRDRKPVLLVGDAKANDSNFWALPNVILIKNDTQLVNTLAQINSEVHG